MKKIAFLPIIFLLVTFLFFQPFLFHGKLPLPSDTIIGLYHPFRDLYAHDYPNGIPYKNFLVTDPVRQQYPWRLLSLETLRQGILPLWNPYTMTGTPLLGNFQSGVLYPLNSIFALLPFATAWGILILLQPLLAGIFLYLYLQNLKLNRFASLLGGLVFSYSGFMISWLEWGTIGQTALWLPLVLLSIDKVFEQKKIFNFKFLIFNAKYVWNLVFLFSLVSAFFAGHLQTFFYLALTSFVYFLLRWIQNGKPLKLVGLFVGLTFCFLLLTFVQWFSTFQFIVESARSVDQIDWHKAGWFIPWQHLVQFVAPDFFGNPTTLNYWGEWNYAEFVGYVGVLPLLLALFAMYARHDKKTYFYAGLLFVSLLFSLPTFLAALPYQLNIPFISTTQPTRLLFLTDFSLAVLAAFGLDYFLKTKKKKFLIFSVGGIGLVLGSLWFFALFGAKLVPSLPIENLVVAKRNLYIPTFFYLISVLLLSVLFVNLSWKRVNKLLDKKLLTTLLLLFIFGLTAFDLFRFSQKFTPFTEHAYLFPSTKALSYLQEKPGQFRVMATDSRILPPNFSIMYKLQSVDGYDPLYLLRYGELITAIQRNKPDIAPPFGFNRIITPQNYDSKFIDLLGVKYVLSLQELTSPKLQQVFVEGQTRIYENKQAFPRTFFVEKIESAVKKEDAITKLFDPRIDLRKTAVVDIPEDSIQTTEIASGTAEIISYKDNEVKIKTQNTGGGFLVLMDAYYPTWHAKVCDRNEKACTNFEIFITNYNFRGVFVSPGEHHVIFYNSLL